MSNVIKMPKIFFDSFVTLVADEGRIEFLPNLMGDVRHGLIYHQSP